MEPRCLIDTNILIYFVSNAIPEKTVNEVVSLFEHSFLISVVTKIEFLGWPRHTEDGLAKAREFLSNAHVLTITDAVAERAIQIRRSTGMKLPDALIAATALEAGLTLVTRNTDDFKKLPELALLNPFA